MVRGPCMNDIPQTLAQMKNRGRSLIGCFPLYPPLELLHSFVLTPVVLWGMREAVQNYDSSDRHLQNYPCQAAGTHPPSACPDRTCS